VTEGEPGLRFRDMTEADVAEGLRLSRASGWNQTLEDWRLLLSLGLELFRVGVLDGRVVATGGAVRYGEALAWICMILVDPEQRGRGLGTRVFDEVLERCRAEVRDGRLRCVGLDATPAGRGIYVKRGFHGGPALVRMRAERLGPVDRPPGVRALVPGDLEAVLALDRTVFGADRGRVLRWALAAAPGLAHVICEGGRILGYCFGRHGDHSDHVGPVVADGGAAARDLVAASLKTADRRPVILDARVAPDWVATLGQMGFREERPFTRMLLDDVRPPGRPELEAAVLGPEFA
jgi:ribosomal protein S18 acetylase RimI-like enzyme